MNKVANEHISKLGFKAQDIVTGFTGVITLISFDLYGCVQFVLTPKVDKDGKSINGRWFDVTRLEIKSRKTVIAVPHNNNISIIDNLGFKAMDIVTGFTGVVSSVGINMHGHSQFNLTPKSDDDGKYSDSDWFDSSRLKLKSKTPVMAIPDFDKGYVAEGKKGPDEKTIPSM